MAWPWGTYLGEEALAGDPREDLELAARSRRTSSRTPSKATGVYLNSMLAVTEAQRAGYDEAIMLTPEGTVADGPGETIFVVKRREDLHARPLDAGSCTGSRATRSSRSRPTSGTRSSRRR